MAHLSELSDDQLLALAGKQPEAFGVFYERHARTVLAFFSQQTRDPQMALDLTAEVFAAALAARQRYRPGEAPATAWLFGIARNKLSASRRREGVAFEARRKLGMPVRTFSDEAIERVEEAVDAAGSDFVAALTHLSAAERDAVKARVIDERGYSEIAAAQDASQAAIRQRVSRGLAKLARIGKGET